MSIYPNNQDLIIVRFACGIILHMKLQNELVCGLNSMKLALNHHFRFEYPSIAWLAGFL